MTFRMPVPQPPRRLKGVKRTEITRDNKIVRTHRDETKPGICHFQILDTVEGGKTVAVTTALR